MVVSKPRSMKNREYEDTEKNIKRWTDININDEQKSDKTETSNCMSTILGQGAQSSVTFLRKSLNCLLMQEEDQDNYKGQENQKQNISTPNVEGHEDEMDPILEERLIP